MAGGDSGSSSMRDMSRPGKVKIGGQ